MLKRLFCLLLVLMLLPAAALAERMYLIPDSNVRDLTAAELWEWDYESLGYILNEIFARHGYVFEVGGKYEHYFTSMPWYTPNANPNNSEACYPKLNNVEWRNEKLIKDVRADMRALGTKNLGGKSVWDNFSTGFSTLNGFNYATMAANQKLSVYAAPDARSYRGANGKAAVSTNGAVYTAGWESGWLLVMYETNSGSVRVGYVDSAQIRGAVSENRLLTFEYQPATVALRCELTDDPARCYAPICTLTPGAQVTYLSTFFNHSAWDYVETTVGGQLVRGFIPAGCLDTGFAQGDFKEVE